MAFTEAYKIAADIFLEEKLETLVEELFLMRYLPFKEESNG